MEKKQHEKPTISIIIPVYHEADTINTFLSHLQTLQGIETTEIIVIDGSPTQDTIKAITTDYPLIRLSSEKGRARQMNTGAAHAQGDNLLFLHADTTLPPHALQDIITTLKTPGNEAGAFTLRIDSDKRRYRLLSCLINLRTRTTRLPYGDQAIFITKHLFNQLSGYRDIPLMEDLDLMRRLRNTGKKITILPDPVTTSPRRWERQGLTLCTLRNWMLRTLYHLRIHPKRYERFYNQD